jgi:photosystem II stability/assembly factor-like uncharacterized protein
MRFIRCVALVLSVAWGSLGAQAPKSGDFPDLRWRSIGPPRSGYISAPAGVPGDPTTYYVGLPEGGVWKSSNGGTTWKPIFDEVRVASVGAVAVAPSDPKVVYVGTGDQSGWSFTTGKGVYKSTDAGRTWSQIGLAASQYIPAMFVDPKNANNVLVAALGPRPARGGPPPTAPPPPNTERGVYRSTDGGRSWTRVLGDGSSGASDVEGDFAEPQIVYALLSDGALHRSTDAGATWKVAASRGLPDGARISAFALASGTRGRRLYALAGAGGRGAAGAAGRALYRSDDGGDSWTFGTGQIASAGGRMYADPQNPDVMYVMGTAMYRSTDGGKTIAAFWGAPSGADPRFLWIDPTNSRRMAVGVDQGVAISVDGGESFTPYYGLVNGQFYRVATDNDFPYHACGPQQDSGTACVASRSDFGEIRPNDWFPAGGFENGFLIPDPRDKRYMFTQGWYHVLRRFDRVTGQTVTLYQPAADERFGGAPPLAFSPQNPNTLYTAAQHVLMSSDKGLTWRTISGDLAAPPGVEIPAAAAAGGGGVGSPAQGGSITTLAPSPVTAGVLWVGTSTGFIHVTRDAGKTWTNVTPPGMPPAGVNVIDASHAQAGTAYAALLSRDAHPHLLRTTDFGAHWDDISSGIRDDGTARVVREDPADPNLVYAGTVTGVYISFNRGDSWNTTLQRNLPSTVVSDMTVRGSDLVISTYGRGFWILDDISPLRQLRAAGASASNAFFFKPEPASRARWDNTQDTPLPPEMKVGDNPPEGVIFDYALPSDARSVTLTISEATGKVVREYSSVAPPDDMTMPNVPEYWLMPPTVLAKTQGMHRVTWDLRYADPPTLNFGYSGTLLTYREYTLNWHALPGQTYRSTLVGPLVLPGRYSARLTVDGKSYTQPVDVIPDPRVDTSPAALVAQFLLQQRMVAGIAVTFDAFNYIQKVRDALRGKTDSASRTLDGALDVLQNGPAGVGAAHRDLGRRLNDQIPADVGPTASVVAGVDAPCAAIDTALEGLRKLQTTMDASLPRWTPPAAPACGR